LKDVVQRADVKGAARRANKTVAGPINYFFRIVLKVIGVAFVISGLSALFGLITAATYVQAHNAALMHDNIFPIGYREHLLLFVAMAILGLIALFIVLFGMAIFKRKWPIHAWVTGGLIGLVFVGLAAGVALAADTVPKVRDRYNANVHTQVRSVRPFTKINAVGKDATIRIEYSDKYFVQLKYYGAADPSAIKTSVSNGILLVDSQKYDWHRHCQVLCIPNSYNMEIIVGSPNAPPKVDFRNPPGEVIFRDRLHLSNQ
jgi:hypothetical protein